ncbi:kinetochore complex Sim4 subunit Fta1-domain-containing protein [Cladorrhinum samala]|uniref:Kinetochore complex Sim4 subunit Fta1-domain-containing protein n=1 Tax=Cladorrhinum samala TaxID=585594 RepID=A0AAV9HWX2_9PEZI|nr:kinetochore complex Sim4 subunit Fta1-domain-containing protein [Cladorrhinum samala]
MPRRRPPPRSPANPQPPTPSAPERDDPTQASLLSTITTTTTTTSSSIDSIASIPFYNTTFSSHRVSPLHLSRSDLTPTRLQTLAQRLRDTLVGDVIRGVEVGLAAGGGGGGGRGSAGAEEETDRNAMGRAGALEGVDVRVVDVGSILGILPQQEEEEEEEARDEDNDYYYYYYHQYSAIKGKTCLVISLRYENAEGTAVLLPSLGRDGETRKKRNTEFFVGVNGTVGRGKAEQGEDRMDIDGEEKDTDTETEEKSMRLPLLLLRMPAPLKSVVAAFLEASFDCRVSPMRLGTRSITRSWEAWISRTAGSDNDGGGAGGKDVVVTLGFNVSPAEERNGEDNEEEDEGEGQEKNNKKKNNRAGLGLKTVDVIIPGTEIGKFEKAGKVLSRGKGVGGWEGDLKRRRELAGRLREEGWEWRAEEGGPGLQPFTEALGRYLREHTAIDLFHPSVRVVKIACGGFVIAEGRIKIFKPAGDEQRRAAWGLLREIIGKAEVQSIG